MRSDMQRRSSVTVPSIHVGTCIQEQRNHVRVGQIACDVETCRIFLYGSVNIRPVLQQQQRVDSHGLDCLEDFIVSLQPSPGLGPQVHPGAHLTPLVAHAQSGPQLQPQQPSPGFDEDDVSAGFAAITSRRSW